MLIAAQPQYPQTKIWPTVGWPRLHCWMTWSVEFYRFIQLLRHYHQIIIRLNTTFFSQPFHGHVPSKSTSSTMVFHFQRRLTFWASTSSIPERIAMGRTGITSFDPSAWLSSRQRHATLSRLLPFTLGTDTLAPKFFMVTPATDSSLAFAFFLFFFVGSSFGSSSTKTKSFVDVMEFSDFFKEWCEIRSFTSSQELPAAIGSLYMAITIYNQHGNIRCTWSIYWIYRFHLKCIFFSNCHGQYLVDQYHNKTRGLHQHPPALATHCPLEWAHQGNRVLPSALAPTSSPRQWATWRPVGRRTIWHQHLLWPLWHPELDECHFHKVNGWFDAIFKMFLKLVDYISLDCSSMFCFSNEAYCNRPLNQSPRFLSVPPFARSKGKP